MSTQFSSDLNMTGMDYLNVPLDFENGFGFSPATSPARDQGKQDFGGYFTNNMTDHMQYMDHNENDFFTGFGNNTPDVSQSNMFPSVNAKVVHGQVTPPSDNSPITAKQESNNTPTPVSLNDTAVPASGTRKKRGAQQSQATSQPSSKRRKNSPRKQSADSSVGDGEENDDKRGKFLERNRVAASKCRQKKKEWTSNLEQKARDLQQNKANLSLLVNSLRDEVLYLKGEVLKHDNCNCTALRDYMSKSVSQISGDAPARSGSVHHSSERSPASDLDLDGMSFSGSPRVTASGGSPSMTT